MGYIIAGIVGGLVVVLLTKVLPNKGFIKSLMKLFYSIKDSLFSSFCHSFEEFKDIAAESKAEYELEKIKEAQAKAERK
ncbi:hypothetical protein [Candidatus Magnetominusculus dajiuhuensis]|uniref:hypothetical protein n=1 Tax=Candidatus Magnetominusculus dajiuhuensis TaxID=3137712 RepID=UPI003B43A65C